MSAMQKAKFEETFVDVGKIYAHPGDIVAADDLSQPQKVKLLRQWEFDLRENLVATEENMTTDATPEGHSAELLRSVRKALLSLGADHRDETAAPTKTGGA